jgi:glycine cleavage system aminomethyltransferase T
VNEPIRRSPLARSNADLGAVPDREAGWELVAHYGDEASERATLRDRVAVADVTARGKIDVRGSLDGALSAAGDVLTARIADDWALLLSEPGGEEVLVPKVVSAAGDGAMVTDATHLFVGFALAGPQLPEALARLTSWDPASLAPGEATGAPIGDVRAVVIRRELPLPLPLPLLEAYVATEFARYAWETVLDAVGRSGGAPVGWRALRAEGWS